MELSNVYVRNIYSEFLKDKADILLCSLALEPLTSIRRNPSKIEQGRFREIFGEDVVEWCEDGVYLPERPSFTHDPLFHSGTYYVQEAGSMFVGHIVKHLLKDLDQDLTVLDLCAAPGGKSTDLLSVLPKSSLLVANEVIKSRCPILAENVAKWGYSNVVVTNNDPRDFSKLTSLFDIVVVDAPCSGEGMFRKDSEAIEQWSEDNVELCVARQKRILADVWPSLKEGGYLLYSTCTFNSHENDDNVEWIINELGAEIVEIPSFESILRTNMSGYQFAPGLTKSEGFFVAVLRKVSSDGETINFKSQKGSVKSDVSINYLNDNYLYKLKGEIVKAYPMDLYQRMINIESLLHSVHSGIAVATQKGKDFIPQADLALAIDFKRGLFPEVELSKEDAIKFLSKENLLFRDAPLGFLLLTYFSQPLGFVKNLGNRSNNLHPMARRIRNVQ